ncbi:uncharacterized protein NFIA_046900, partial [Aspergillus fischeri NRRL 181]
MEQQLFIKLSQPPVIICRSCRHGVWLAEVESHLRGKAHRLPQATAKQIHQDVQSWEGVEHDPHAVQWPSRITQSIPHLDEYPDGLLCQRDQARCQFITRSLNTLKRHWREHHGWTAPYHGGRSRLQEQEQAQITIQQGYQVVTCQRFFPSRKGSHYIWVPCPNQQPEEQARTAPTAHIQATIDAVIQAWEQVQAQAKADQAIQASQLTDANPWLRMTRWADYLQGIQARDLLASMAAPEEDPMDATEQGVQVIWDTMEQVARKSQRTVQHCGQAIRVEAVRSEKGQTPHRPLLAYIDEAVIKKHVQPWQQILAFIARTQAPHDWASPRYGMTARQRQKWRQLWQLASQAPGSQGSQAAVPGDLEAWAMTAIEKACLEFCIELLNQRHRSHEYESALVCAMAVLGQGEAGWRDPESYPPILSRVIK